MKSLLVKKDDNIKINFVVGQTIDGKILCSDKKEDNFVEFQEHFIVIKKPSYGENIDILSNILNGEMSNIKINPLKLRLEKISYLIKDWSFVDEKGEKLPMTKENIFSLETEIGNHITSKIDELT